VPLAVGNFHEAGSDFAKNRITGLMAIRIIDILEIVYVTENQAQGLLALSRLKDPLLEGGIKFPRLRS